MSRRTDKMWKTAMRVTALKPLTIDERWEQGIPHDPRSEEIAKGLAEIDLKEGGDSFCFKFGGDGDNGEQLMYLLDIYFEREDNKAGRKKR